MAVYEATGTGTTGAQYYTLKLEVNETSYSVENNTSVVSWALYLTSKNNYSFSNWSFPVIVNIDGEVYNSSEYRSMPANSTVTIASGTKTIEHNSDGTKTISCSATVAATGASYLPGNMSVSGDLKLTDIPRYANFTEHYVSSTGLNSVTIKWNADAGCDAVQYSLNGSGWVNTSGLNYTVSGLKPNTQYSIKTRIKRQDSQLWTESGIIYATTKDIAKLTTYNNSNLGDNLTVQYTNPSNASVVIGIYGMDGLTPYASYRTTSGGSYTFNFTDEELDKLYKAFPNSNTITVRLYLRTSGDTYYYDTKDIIITLKGNQKTGHVNVNGSWKRSKKWINVNGAWKRCVRWINVNGSWKRCA